MNYKAWVSWGVFGGTSADERAHLFASWGIMAAIESAAANIIVIFMNYYKRLM